MVFNASDCCFIGIIGRGHSKGHSGRRQHVHMFSVQQEGSGREKVMYIGI